MVRLAPVATSLSEILTLTRMSWPRCDSLRLAAWTEDRLEPAKIAHEDVQRFGQVHVVEAPVPPPIPTRPDLPPHTDRSGPACQGP